MAKFSSKEKIRAVRRYLEGTEGGKTIAKSIGVHSSMLYQWIRQYESLGENAFEKRYTSYSPQYKLDVLHYMNEQGTSIRGHHTCLSPEKVAFFLDCIERIPFFCT
ncbi:transposase family protein [Bacillus clarus]|uniref:Transposase family protein n=1 Tax=Bacillus clarus TaxID=2338372 RepID=A0A090YD31_9BACI|nr:transposase family protein [Bacillus clarus]